MTKTAKTTMCERCKEEKRPKDYLGDRTVCKDCSMINLSVQAIKDYQVCSLYYDYKYNDKLYSPTNNRTLMAERFHETMSRVAAFFFYKKQSGITPSYNAIVNRWERLWFPKDMDAYDLAVETHTVSHGNLTQYSTIGVQGLKKLYDDFSDVSIQPMLIDEEFSVPVTPEIILNGKIDLVYRVDGKYKLIKWSTQGKKPNPQTMQMEFAELKFAYDHHKPAGQKVSYALYDLGSEHPGMIDVDMSTIPSGLIEYWCSDLRDGSYVPRRGYTAYCKGCPYDDPCSKFDFEGVTK